MSAATLTQAIHTAPDGEVWLRVHPDCTRRTSLSRTTLYEAMNSGKLQSKKVGGRRVIPASALAAFMSSFDGGGEV